MSDPVNGPMHDRDPNQRPQPRAARMVDVARLAGVSPQTVSRVVNNHPNVTPAVRQRVQEAIKQLRYRRNPVARSLVTSRTMSIGVVSWGLTQHGPSVALTGIAEAARREGYTTNLVGLAETDKAAMRAAIGHLVNDHVDGIIVLAPVEAAVHALDGVSTDVPLVVFEPGGTPRPNNFAVDEVAGARIATEHLVQLGHAGVLHLCGPPGWLATEARIRGWREALAAAGLPAPEPVVTSWDAASGCRAAAEVIARPKITAVFVANDQTALGLMAGLTDRGVRIPDDIAVVGFDDFPEAAYFRPPLTTVRVDFAALGRLAVGKILALVRGERIDDGPPVVPELIVRASSVGASWRQVQNGRHEHA